jgi:signal transduction histidine kinase
MTLYKKIILVFVGVAIVPLIIFAAVAREEALAMADAAAGDELLSGVTAASRVLEQEAAVAQSALRSFSQLGGPDVSEDFLGRALASAAGPPPDGFHYLAVVEESGDVRAAVGDAGAGGICADGHFSYPVRVETPLGTGSDRLVGAFRVGALGTPRVGRGLWVYDGSGQLLAASSCEEGPDLSVAQVPTDVPTGVMRTGATPDGSGEALVFARVPSLGWTVVATGSSQLRAPLAGFFRDYWLFVLGLAGTTLLAFSFFLRPITSYLNDLTGAVERVASGDLRPWFPTPRDDEVGRLSMAFYDMTERLREMVRQVDRSSRLAVLGKLSAYLAHEIRNPLSSVKMNLQRLQRWQRRGEIPEHCGDAIEISLTEVGRLSAAVSNILQLSPSKARPREVVALHDLVEEVGQLLDADFVRRGVSLRWELNAEADRVLGEPGQLKGVVINLMLNALDAQPDGGELLVQSVLRTGEDPGRGGPVLELRFRDQGTGVPAGIEDRIFEPFFTTKGGGSGIGLAVVSQTVRDHGGDVFLAERTRVAQGAEFVVRLPLAAVVRERAPGQIEARVAPWMEEVGGPDRS